MIGTSVREQSGLQKRSVARMLVSEQRPPAFRNLGPRSPERGNEPERTPGPRKATILEHPHLLLPNILLSGHVGGGLNIDSATAAKENPLPRGKGPGRSEGAGRGRGNKRAKEGAKGRGEEATCRTLGRVRSPK
eukprot:3600017-Pyramimonas_sp.AAC.1